MVSKALLALSSFGLLDNLTGHAIQDNICLGIKSVYESFENPTKTSLFSKATVTVFILSLSKVIFTIFMKRRRANKIKKEIDNKNIRLFDKLESFETPKENAKSFAAFDDNKILESYMKKDIAPVDFHDGCQYRAIQCLHKGYINEIAFDSDVTAIIAESNITSDYPIAGLLAAVDEHFDIQDMYKPYQKKGKKIEKNSGIIEIIKNHFIVPMVSTNSKSITCSLQPSRSLFGQSCGTIAALLDGIVSIGIGRDVNGTLRLNAVNTNFYCVVSQKAYSTAGLDSEDYPKSTMVGLVTRDIETLDKLNLALLDKRNVKYDPNAFVREHQEENLDDLKIGYFASFIDEKPEFLSDSQKKSFDNVLERLKSKDINLVEFICERPSKKDKQFLDIMTKKSSKNTTDEYAKGFLKIWRDLEIDFLITPVSSLAMPKKLTKETLESAYDFLNIANKTGLSAGVVPLFPEVDSIPAKVPANLAAKLNEEFKDVTGLYSGVQIIGRGYDETRLIKLMKIINAYKN